MRTRVGFLSASFQAVMLSMWSPPRVIMTLGLDPSVFLFSLPCWSDHHYPEPVCAFPVCQPQILLPLSRKPASTIHQLLLCGVTGSEDLQPGLQRLQLSRSYGRLHEENQLL